MAVHVRRDLSSEDFLARLTFAIYKEVLYLQKDDSLVEWKLRVLQVLQDLLREDMVVVKGSNLFSSEEGLEPWSREALRIELDLDE